MSTSLLDLVGVLLIGVVAAVAIAAVSGYPLPTPVTSVLSLVGVDTSDLLTVAVVLAVVAGLLLILKSGLNTWLTRRSLRFLARRQAQISGALASGLLALPLLRVQSRSSQSTAYALTNGVNFATLYVLGQGIVAVSEISLLVVLTVGLLAVSPIVTLFSVGFFALIAVIIQRVLSGWASSLGTAASAAEVGSYATLQEAIRSYREALVTHRRALYVERFEAARWTAASVQSDLHFISLAPKYVFEVALVVGAGLLAVSQFLTADLLSAVSTIAVFLAAGSRIVPSMLRLQGAVILVRSAGSQALPTYMLASELNFHDGTAQGKRLDDVDADRLAELIESGYQGFSPTLLVNKVSFTYPASQVAALNDVTFTLAAGDSLALVGRSGSGKSTLADVLLGVLSPSTGEVLIGGRKPLEAIAAWPGAVAYVPQEVSLFDATVRENVALGLPAQAIDDTRVWEALEGACLADFVRSLPEGASQALGESGVSLSGGQRQRLGIARALYTKPRLIVMDEATSALDAETEHALARTLAGLAGRVTTVTIAHRLSTVRTSKTVLYLNEGEVLASGSFDEVRRAVPMFDNQVRLMGLI